MAKKIDFFNNDLFKKSNQDIAKKAEEIWGIYTEEEKKIIEKWNEKIGKENPEKITGNVGRQIYGRAQRTYAKVRGVGFVRQRACRIRHSRLYRPRKNARRHRHNLEKGVRRNSRGLAENPQENTRRKIRVERIARRRSHEHRAGVDKGSSRRRKAPHRAQPQRPSCHRYAPVLQVRLRKPRGQNKAFDFLIA